MARIAKKLTELVGNTPLLELNSFSRQHSLVMPLLQRRKDIIVNEK